MICPVCARNLAPTLSICPSCGAMMYDTVREELQTKITPGIPRLKMTIESVVPEAEPVVQQTTHKPEPPEIRASAIKAPEIKAPEISSAEIKAPQIKPPLPSAKRTQTAGLSAPKTSPTLVEFQNKNASLPDWRLQLQNAVQQRKGANNTAGESANSSDQLSARAGAALKAEIVSRSEPEIVVPEISDPRVANALRRIAESRSTFLEKEAPQKRPAISKPHRFGVVSTSGASTGAAPALVRSEIPVKPTLVSPAPIVLKRDTNKLPRIERVEALSAEPDRVIESEAIKTAPTEVVEVKRIHISAEHIEDEPVDVVETYSDDIEDLAPFSMRFSAGLFDLIIGAFVAGILLSPLAFTGGEWLTGAGLLTFAAAWAIVSFVYMTLCLGFYGKTMGMRLFALELVDAVENEYPTLRQAGVNSSVFLVSLVFGGAGFLTTIFNEERRALHDLLSGTIIVREF